jgi:hypothetical protein
VHVDQSGKQRGLRQVDRGVARRRLDFAGGCDPRDLAAFDDDRLAGAQLTRAHVEQAPGSDHGPLRRRRLCCGRGHGSGQERESRRGEGRPAFQSARGSGRP